MSEHIHRLRSSGASRSRDWALFKYALIRPLVDPEVTPAQRGLMLAELAGAEHAGPAGQLVRVGRSTLERWLRQWRQGGFDALLPSPRQARPRTDEHVLQLALALKRENPARSCAHIRRIITAHSGWAPSERTLLRHFTAAGLGGRPSAAAKAAGNADVLRGRFEAGACDQIWVGDGLHGPKIEGRRAVLIAVMDDHSRYIVGARWGFGEDTIAAQAVLRDALAAHGIPDAWFFDNGAAFTSSDFAWSAAVLGIRLMHSRPGDPKSRGKIERWNRTCREQFLIDIDVEPSPGARPGTGSPVSGLDELNALFSAWLHQGYHRQVHSETGQSPAQRYAQRTQRVRPQPAQLHRAFRWHAVRTVTPDGLIHLNGNRYQVEASLAGRKVDVLFNPFDLTDIDIEHNGVATGKATPFSITRHADRRVKPATTAPVEATGIDYHRLLEAQHQREVGHTINFHALLSNQTGSNQTGSNQTGSNQTGSNQTGAAGGTGEAAGPPCGHDQPHRKDMR